MRATSKRCAAWSQTSRAASASKRNFNCTGGKMKFPFGAPVPRRLLHTPAGGVTSIFSSITLKKPKFQFTRPRGAGRRAATRLHRGRLVSIHTPAGGVTHHTNDKTMLFTVSIHTPAGGRDGAPAVKSNISLIVSIHTPAGGVTQWQHGRCRHCKCFNSHARGRRDTNLFITSIFETSFNSHARGGRDNVPCPLRRSF